ncbi:MAG TPA: ABC transporter substrate-binding protein [Phycisphaerae bacterium]|nr:ABC transporter substrate-binding protein [Phycisphaerae bacterium]
MIFSRLFLAASLVLLLAACGRTEAPATAPATQTASAPDTIPAGPRIVSTVPAATLNLVLIGAVDTLVGISTYDQPFLPDDKQNLPIVGDYFHLSYETLVALHPTAIIIQDAEPRIPTRLRELATQHHFDIVNIKIDTMEDIWGAVKTLGKVSNHDAGAAAGITEAREELKLLSIAMENRPHPKVLYVLERSPMSVAGSGSFMGEIIELAGGENVGAKVPGLYPAISNETLVKLAPDVLLISAPSQMPQHDNDDRLEPFAHLPIPAAWNNRIFLVTDGDAMVASLKLPRQVQELAAMIHKGESSTATSPAGGGHP